MRIVSEIIKSFLNEMNAQNCYNKMINEYNVSISLESIESIQLIYTEIRRFFSKYYNIVYQSELLGYKNASKNFSVDESLFISDKDHNDIWVIEITDNGTKDFRIDISSKRNASVL